MNYESVINELLEGFIEEENNKINNKQEIVNLEQCKNERWTNFVYDEDLKDLVKDKKITLIQTIGTSKPPILFSLLFFKPTYVYHICSDMTLQTSLRIKEKFENYRLAKMEIKRLQKNGNDLYENIKVGYEALRDALELDSLIVLDLTGGKKTMSSSLANLYVQLYQDEDFKRNSLLVYIEKDDFAKKSRLWNISNAIQINAYYSYLLRKKNVFSKSYDFAYEAELLKDVNKYLHKLNASSNETTNITRESDLLNSYSYIHNKFKFPNYKDMQIFEKYAHLLGEEKTKVYNKIAEALEVMKEWSRVKTNNKNIDERDNKNDEYKLIKEGFPYLILHFYLMSNRLKKQKKEVEASLYAYRGIEALCQYLLIKEFESLDFYKGKSDGFKFDKEYISKFFDYEKLNNFYKKLMKREGIMNKDYDEIENIRSGLTSYLRTYFAIILYKSDNKNIENLAEKLSYLFSRVDSAIVARNNSILIHGYEDISSADNLLECFKELLNLCEKELVLEHKDLQKMIEIMLYPYEKLEDFWQAK